MNIIQKMIAKKEAERLTVKELSTILDVPEGRINSWIRRAENQQKINYEDAEKISNWIKGIVKKPTIVEEQSIKYENSNDRYLGIIEKQQETIHSQQQTIAELVRQKGNVPAGKIS
jgi:hypothetical protein